MPTPEELATVRKRAGFRTQKDLAAHLGVSLGTINNWENGRRPIPTTDPKLNDLLAKYGAFGRPTDETVAQILARASDLDLIAALTARMAELRAAAGSTSTSTGHADQDALLEALTLRESQLPRAKHPNEDEPDTA